MEISLENLRPQDAEIVVGGESYKIRKFNAGDEAWLRETFGSNFNVLQKMTDENMFRIVFHQLYNEDKLKFKAISVEIINEDTGESVEGTLGGWKLMRQKTVGLQEKMGLYKALAHTVGISRPMWDKITEDEKKKLNEFESEVDSKKKKSIGRK